MAVNKMIEQIKEKTANQSNDNNYEVPGIIPMIGLLILIIMVIISILDEIPLKRDTYTATRRYDDENKKDYTDSELATGLLLGSMLASQNHRNSSSYNDDEDNDSYSSHSNSRNHDDDDDNYHSSSSSSYHDDDDDDWFSGSSSDWSSSDWSGGGFDGGGASGDW